MRFGRTCPGIILLSAAALGAAPASPTSLGVERAVAAIRADWAKPGAAAQPNAPGWNAFFDRLKADLDGYANAPDEGARLRSLNSIYQMDVALHGSSWPKAAEVDAPLREWLRPRIALSWAASRLREAVVGLPATADPGVRGNRQQWIRFVDEGVAPALKDYEGAQDVGKRLAALSRLRAVLDNLEGGNKTAPWAPSVSLQRALDDLFDRPNLDATADARSVAPALANDVVTSGPITYKGQTSYVTAGQRTGFGLLASDAGISFYNRQALSTVTPIQDFQRQVSADQKGKRAAKLYQFDATSNNQAQLTIFATLTPEGLSLTPSYQHGIAANVGSVPQADKGLARGLAAVLGLGQGKITQKVYDSAIDKIVSGVVEGSAELAQIKAYQAAAEKNAGLQRFLVGNRTLVAQNIAVKDLTLRSRPEGALIGGIVTWSNAPGQSGADSPEPAEFAAPAPGVTADLHLGSIASNMARGFYTTPKAQQVDNLMLITGKPAPGAPPGLGAQVRENVDFATYMKAVADAQATNDPQVSAIRVVKPKRPPEFAADARGYLVALVHDFSLDVPAPPGSARGGLTGPPAKIYRFVAPEAQIAIELNVVPPGPGGPMRVVGKVREFDPGPGSKVLAIMDDEAKAAKMNGVVSRIAFGQFGNRLKSLPIDVPLDKLNLPPNLRIDSISKLDPSGWMRVVVTPGVAAAAATVAPKLEPTLNPSGPPTE